MTDEEVVAPGTNDGEERRYLFGYYLQNSQPYWNLQREEEHENVVVILAVVVDGVDGVVVAAAAVVVVAAAVVVAVESSMEIAIDLISQRLDLLYFDSF
ncbi:unnamed protein product [[Candida] boidinii]|nr:unnamed protein product [[Candida] boidinii]